MSRPEHNRILTDLPEIDPERAELTIDTLLGLAFSDQHDRSGKLHLSQLDDCNRKVMLEFYGVEGVPVTPRQAYMFHIANEMHEDLFEALADAGMLVACEYSLEDELPPDWSGRIDAVVTRPQRRIMDLKTNHPNFLRYADRIKLPKANDALQVTSYEIWGGWMFETKDDPIVVYKDRGGQNAGRESVVRLGSYWHEHKVEIVRPTELAVTSNVILTLAEEHLVPKIMVKTMEKMVDKQMVLDKYRVDLRLPEPLGLEFQLSSPDKISLVPPWRCGYCQYAETTHCDPIKAGGVGVLRYDNTRDRWIVMRNGKDHAQKAVLWAFNELGMEVRM